jgi:hypothetical protein
LISVELVEHVDLGLDGMHVVLLHLLSLLEFACTHILHPHLLPLQTLVQHLRLRLQRVDLLVGSGRSLLDLLTHRLHLQFLASFLAPLLLLVLPTLPLLFEKALVLDLLLLDDCHAGRVCLLAGLLVAHHTLQEGKVLDTLLIVVSVLGRFTFGSVGVKVLVAGVLLTVGDIHRAVHVTYAFHELLVGKGFGLDPLLLLCVVVLVERTKVVVVGAYSIFLGLLHVPCIKRVLLLDHLLEDQVTVLPLEELIVNILELLLFFLLPQLQLSPLPDGIVLLGLKVLLLVVSYLLGVNGTVLRLDSHQLLVLFLQLGDDYLHAKLLLAFQFQRFLTLEGLHPLLVF